MAAHDRQGVRSQGPGGKSGCPQAPPGGREWHAGAAGLELTWQETGQQIEGAMPAPRGFGTTLAARLIASEPGGRVDRQIGETGWTTSLAIPASALAR